MNEKILKFFDKDLFAKGCGAQLIEVTQGSATAKMKLTPSLCNAAGGIQGGAIFTLADFAFAAATNSHGSLTVALNVNIQYFRQPKGEFITAVAREISRGRRICGCNVEVFDEDGSLVASFNGTGYIKDEKLEF